MLSEDFNTKLNHVEDFIRIKLSSSDVFHVMKNNHELTNSVITEFQNRDKQRNIEKNIRTLENFQR